MGVASVVVIAATIVVVVVFIVWMIVLRNNPESASTHGEVPGERARRETDDLARGVDRPADPNAEAQGPLIGDASPGPVDHPR